MVEDLLRAAPTEAAAGSAPRLRRPWWTRLSRAHVAALLAAAVAGVLNVLALQQDEARTAVLVAARELAAGAALDETAVGSTPISADAPLLGTLIPADRLAERTGWVLARSLRAGEPLRWSDLRDPAARDGLRAMSLPVEAEHAAGGALRAGDRVDVIAVREGQAFWVVADVEILDATESGADGALASPRPYALTLALTEQQALRLAWALHDGAIEVVRATGASPLVGPGDTLGGSPAGPPPEETP